MSSIFTKIINGEIPSYKVFEDKVCIAILDVFPIREGHVLIIPKSEIDYWVDLDELIINHCQAIAKKLARAIKKATNCTRVGQIVDGRQVPHYHLHLVPLHDDQKIITDQKPQFTKEEFENMKNLIAGYFS
jgi:histidine triad (HIT) family protein